MDGSESATAIAGSESNCRRQFSYTSKFCEENVHKMISKFKTLIEESSYPTASFHAVFISSRSRQTPIWHQKAGVRDEPVWWDYHVILVAKGLSTAVIDVLCHTPEEMVISKSNQAHGVISSDRVDISSSVAQPNQKDQQLRSYVFDLDSNLPFPTAAYKYYHEAMRPELEIPIEHVQVFRVVPGVNFLNYFASDRLYCVMMFYHRYSMI